MNSKIKKLSLLLGDIIILYLSLYFTLFLRYGSVPNAQRWLDHFWPFTITFIAWIFIFYISNLYNLHLAINNAQFFQATLRSIALGGSISALFFYLNNNLGVAPKTNLLIFLVLFTLLFISWRRIYNWLIYAYVPKDNIAFIGYNGQVNEMIKYLKKNPHLGFRPALIVQESISDAVSDVPTTNMIGALDKILSEKKITTLVLVSDPHQSNELRASLFKCLPLKVNFFSLTHFYETVTGKIPTDSITQMWFLENLSEGNKTAFDIIKRIYDIIFAIFILVATLPFWVLIALVIKLESRGPVFFMSERSGRHGKKFNLIKFRTMREDNNDHAPTRFDDPRITKFGNFLRKTRLDEIPQVINIIFSEMSFVGPRPERPELIEELEKVVPFYDERMLVKPGLTGWDQISGEYHSPSREDTLKKLQYDLFYIKNRSIYLDLSIILKTITTVITRAGI